MTVKLLLIKSENGLETRQDYDGLSSANPAFTGTLTGGSAELTGSVDAGGEIKSGALVGTGARPVVALADGTIDDQPPATFLGTIGALAASLKGAANGVAELGADGRVPSGQLPSYVDDVLEYANFAALPATGETGKIYITQDNNKTWRWSGSAYVEISASLALGETSATAYRGDRGKTAYDHSQLVTGNPHGTTAADVGALASTNPEFTGALKQGGTTRITSGGGGWFASMQSTNLVGAGDRPVAADLTGTLQPKTPDQFRSMISALAASLKGAADGVAELGADVKIPVAQLPSAALLALGSDSTTAHRGDHGTTAYNHSQATGNPHGTTAAQVGAAKAPSKADVSASTTIGSIDATAIKVTATDVILTLSGGVDGQGWDIINPTASTGIAIPSGATLWKSIGSSVGPTTIALGGGRPIRITRIDANTWTMLGSQ